jgi:hypothetical protein
MNGTTKEQAEVFRYCLMAGCTSPVEVVEWATSVVADVDHPEIEIIDLAIAADASRVRLMELLDAVPGVADRILVLRRVLGVLDDALQADSSQGESIAKWLYDMASTGELPQSEFGTEIFGLGDSFSLAQQGFGGSREAGVERLHQYLILHACTA